jgi:hypothetical protein
LGEGSAKRGINIFIVYMSLQHMNENAENKPKWIRQHLIKRKFLVKLPKNRVALLTNRIAKTGKQEKSIVIL